MNDYNKIEWKEYFYYDEDSPSGLCWKINSGKAKLGDLAGSKTFTDKNKTKPKCWDVRFKGKLYKVHRIIWILLNGEISNEEINHIDNDPFNNRAENLELVNRNLNMRRCSSHTGKQLQINNVTGFNGVSEMIVNGNHVGYNASFIDLNGKRHVYSFTISRYGKELSLNLAITTRNYFINELNKKGAGYG